MSYRHLNTGIIVRLIIFGALVAGLTWTIIGQRWDLTVIAVVLILFSAGNFIYFNNSINRKLTFFFNAVKNEDSTLSFPENLKNKSLNELHTSLNRINKIISDIKIKQAHNEKFFLEFMKRSATGLMAVDEQGYVEIVNDAAIRLLGMAHITHLARLQQDFPALYDAMVNLKVGHSKTIKLLDGSELRQITIKVAQFNFSQKQYRIYSLYDIKAEMEENELETWQKLIRILTHEIMNSIAPITSISKTLSGYYVKNGERTKFESIGLREIDNTVQGLAVIEDRAQGLLHFVDNYRKLTKIPQPVFKPIDINDWLNCILLLFQSRMEEENIALERIEKYKKKEFPGDSKLLTQVVINLLNNAADALKDVEDKKITIQTSETQNGSFKLEIIDNGKGMAEDQLDKIFIPFYTTKEHGSGIGLSLSRQIMRMHKGSISAHSIPGKRTVFELKF